MTEKLDPEEVREIMTRVFGEIAQVVTNYEGFIEKFIGDAVMALFGVPKSHEDDPIRAIRAAREIHERIENLNPELQEKIGRPLSMHTGINTGLVITGKVDTEKGTHGVAGDTINVASRLQSLASNGEILVGQDTSRQAEGHFVFENLEPTHVKGKAEALGVYKLIASKDKPVTTHRLSGLRAELVGRKVEMADLQEAIANLEKGKGKIFSVCGDAGTGKSRLVEDFKATLDLDNLQWIEGHAYAYAQNIPYFPVIDLLSRIFKIEEEDPQRILRAKVETEIERLGGNPGDVAPYVGRLYGLRYAETEDVSPEFWRSRLQESVQAILTGLAKKKRTVFLLEDLHWADPSSVDLIRRSCLEIRQPAIVLCVYRPSFSLFTSHQLTNLGKIYQEIRLQDLSLSDAQDMLGSLLKTKDVPSELRRLVQNKTGGNPFFLEELINSLIESEALARENGGWRIKRKISESEISSSIHGLISGRLDRLEKETKRILQEASVIGRAFLYEILVKISEIDHRIDQGLSTLERLDLIRTRSLQPDLEYMFKHPLTHEVVYNGLLKKDRQEIHEHIALVMESIFKDRLPEFYGTLAYHFKRGRSVLKAVDYLMKSGEKSMERYAIEESHQYFKEAYDLLSHKPGRTKDEEGLLIELLIKWALVFYYRGDTRELVNLLSLHRVLAESLEDKVKLGMFYAWYGFSLWFMDRHEDSYEYLLKALKIGQEEENQKVIGYACNWISWTCTELGLFDEGLRYGEKALAISKQIPSDHYLFFKSLGGVGYASFAMGNRKRTFEAGKTLLEYGHNHSNIRSMVMGYIILGFSYLTEGDYPSVIEACGKGVQTAQDALYAQMARCFLGIGYLLNGQFREAEGTLQEIAAFSRDFGCVILGTAVHGLLGFVFIEKGKMGHGLKMIEETLESCSSSHRKYWNATFEHYLGQIYLKILDKSTAVKLTTMAKNVGFILKNVPSAEKKALEHFTRAMDIAEGVGAKGIQGEVFLDLGRLHMAKGRRNQTRDCYSQAIEIFERHDLNANLRKAREESASLGLSSP
jgi:class 3 adenylate cyclase/tetratricopeptide (TPR) repeat protein